MWKTLATAVWHRLPAPVRNRMGLVLASFYGAPSFRQYAREAMNRDLAAWFSEMPTDSLDAVEVSGNHRGGYGWKSYTSLEFPQFDLLTSEAPGQFDVVICEQVLEHVKDPDTAVATLRSMTRTDGRILVSTPFLLRIHGSPNDYWRFTPAGLRILLERQGLEVESIRSWGNRAAVKSNLRRWSAYRPWRSLKSHGDLPVVVWAIACPQVSLGESHAARTP